MRRFGLSLAVLGVLASFLLLGLGAAWSEPETASGTTAAALASAVPADSLKQDVDWGARVRSGVGLFVMLFLAYLLSTNRRAISLRLVVVGVVLQLVLGLFTLTAPGRFIFTHFNDLISGLLGFTGQGAGFLFGQLSSPPTSLGAFFAFGVLPTIIFFSSLMAVLYHLGVMQQVVKAMAKVMQKSMGTSGAESLSAAGNIFVGQTEAPLLVRPFLNKMTQSELMAVMTGGFATVAGGVMAAYVGMLREVFPDIAGHLLSASIMSAPAALVVAKIMIPEPQPELSETYGGLKAQMVSEDANVIDAAARGASDGLRLALNVGAMLLAFIALIAMINALVGWLGGLVGFTGLSLEGILGYLLAPIAWIMGVPWEDARQVGSLLGVKTVLNEFVAYLQLADGAKNLAHYRSMVIASYALCGFANFGSLAILLGGLGAMAPSRRGEIANLGLRSIVSGSLATFMTACIAGILL